MKIRLVVALVGLAISFALPTFAQQKDTADPEITQKIRAISKGFDEAENNNNAAGIAALFTEDAVFVADGGPVYGRQAIEKRLAAEFGARPSNFSHKLVQVYAIGNDICAITEWSLPPVYKGHSVRIYGRDADTW